jgi:hypothetical protein
MSATFEGRQSDSPYIEMIWRGQIEQDYAPVCPADVRWNLLFIRQGKRVRVTAEGATTQFVPKFHTGEQEFLVIKFKLGVYMPHLPASEIVDTDEILPQASGQSFWLNRVWQLPTFENAETFVAQLARDGIIVHEPVVNSVLQGQFPDVSSRTIRRRFLNATGLTPVTIAQIERAQQALALLERGTSILDVVHQVGYADQPHLTRSLRRFIGSTPAQVMQSGQPA